MSATVSSVRRASMSVRLLGVCRPLMIRLIVSERLGLAAVRPLSSPFVSNHCAPIARNWATRVRILRIPLFAMSYLDLIESGGRHGLVPTTTQIADMATACSSTTL